MKCDATGFYVGDVDAPKHKSGVKGFMLSVSVFCFEHPLDPCKFEQRIDFKGFI